MVTADTGDTLATVKSADDDPNTRKRPAPAENDVKPVGHVAVTLFTKTTIFCGKLNVLGPVYSQRLSKTPGKLLGALVKTPVFNVYDVELWRALFVPKIENEHDAPTEVLGVVIVIAQVA